jgi:hypothetical protein
MADGTVPAEAYFPSSSLMGERIRGAQLASMEQNQAREEARMKGMMGALGVSSPEEAYEMKARQDIESQRLGDFEDFLTGADEIYETYGGDSEEFQGYKEAYKGIWSPYLADFNIAGPKGKDHDRILTITPTQDTPMEIAGKEVILKKGVTYEQGLKGPDAVWAREMAPTEEAKAKKAKGADATALQKNTAFIAKTLKIPQEKALQMALESKQQSREGFILDMIKRAMTASMGRLKPDKLKSIEENAGNIWDSLHAKESPETAPEATKGEQDWLGSVIEGG